MTITKPNEIAKLPISVPVSSSVTFVTLVRDVYNPITLTATALSASIVAITIPSGMTAGLYDWEYGDNKGLLEVVVDEELIEYDDAVMYEVQYETNDIINDNVTNQSQTWSSQKITDELNNVMSGVAVNCYSKYETDTLLNLKADKSTTYTKTQVQGYLSAKADKSNTYTTAQTYSKTEVNSLLSGKADSANTYTKAETNTLLNAKANASDVYTKSQIDNTVNNLNTAINAKANSSDVYTKVQTYNKVEVDSLLAAIATFEAVVVSALPQVGDTKKMYFVPKQNYTGTTNVYEEYLWVRDVVGQGYHYELVGETGIDMSNYYTKAQTYSKTEVNTLLSGKQDTLVSATNIKTIGNQSLLGSGNIWAVSINGDDLDEQ